MTDTKNLQPHELRVVEEEKKLATDLANLSKFIDGNVFKNLDTEDQKLLCEQKFHMGKYLEILNKRIVRFHLAA